MGWNDHIDFELSEKLQDLIEDGVFEEGTPARGITLLVIDAGLSVLSPKQRYIYDNVIEPELVKAATARFGPDE